MRRRGQERRRRSVGGRERRRAEVRDRDGPLGVCEVLDGVGRVSGDDGLEPRDGDLAQGAVPLAGFLI